MSCALSGEKLTSCFDSLKPHFQLAYYQAAVWRRFSECNPTIPNLVGHDSSEDENGINIVWNECSPAPNEVLYLLLHLLKEMPSGTLCLDIGLQCTDSCHTNGHENMLEDFLNGDMDALVEEEYD